jgi:signal transduction histidine kinase
VYNEVLLGRASLDRLPVGIVVWDRDGAFLFANRLSRDWLRIEETTAPDEADFWRRFGLDGPPPEDAGTLRRDATNSPAALEFQRDTIRNLEGQAVATALYLAPAPAATPPQAAHLGAATRTLGILLFRAGRLDAWAGLSARWPALDTLAGAGEAAVLDHLAREVDAGRAPRFVPAREALSDGSVLVLAQTGEEDAPAFAEPFGPERWIAATAHEIRNPLATIRGFLQILPDAGPEERSRYAAIAMREVDRIVEVVDEFLEAPADGDSDAPPPVADLTAVTQAAVADLELEAADAGAVIALDLPTAPLWVQARGGRLRQVVSNLVRNALLSVPSPGGRVWLEARAEGDRVRLTVEDDGPGVPQAWSEEVFRPDFSRREGGHGLGLAIAHWVVTLYGGTIAIARSRAGGARFDVFLPAVASGIADAAAAGDGRQTPLA